MRTRYTFSIFAGVSLAAMAMAAPAIAQETTETDEEARLDVVEVTGFRGALAEALSVKRFETGSVDAIFAEDIADFPDQNLAESLQRVPGVAITRDSGEGRGLTVRGLGGDYTRVRINGMEAQASTGGEGGPNRGRGFDFNVFASELFNQIVVRKTASADVDEGSLGAVVDLYTGHPLDYSEGFTGVANVQGQYNDVSEDFGPRLAGLLAWNDPSGKWGISGSIAYSDNQTIEEGQNTVRWQRATFNSVNGVDCGLNPADAGCTEVSNAFHPRIPRYGNIVLDRERMGLTGSFQWQPTATSKLTVDALYSKYDASRGEQWGEVLFRGNEGGMDVNSYTYDAATNNLTSMSVDNAWVRMENFEKAWTTDFTQFTANYEHDWTDRIHGNLLVGTSESDLSFPYEITFMYDNRSYDGFFYDYSNDEFPTIAFQGADVTDPSTFQLTELRDRPSSVVNGYDTAAYDVEWEFADNYAIAGGLSYKKYTFDTTGQRRDTGVCGVLYDCDPNGDGVNELDGIPATAALSDLFTFGGDVGTGTTTQWLIPSLSGWSDYFNLSSLPLRDDQGNIRSVQEETLGAFLMLNGNVPLGSMDLRFDVGVRYVETDQKSSGFNSGTYVTVDREPYDDVLPSANVALNVTDDLILRASAAKVMTRPGLGNLSPGGSVDSFNYRVSFSNPNLDPTRATNFDAAVEWYFADESLFSVAVFHKDIESFPIGSSNMGTYASTGLPLDLLVPTSPTAANPEGGPAESCNPANGGVGCWEIRSLDNGPGAKITGAELSLQLPFDVMTEAPVISDMGFIGNYTYVDSDTDYNIGGTTYTERLLGLSNVSYNATLYYETDKFKARIAASYRDDYLTGTSGNSNVFEGYGETFNVDFSSTYTVNDRLDLTFEALNLTDDYQDRFTDLENMRRYEYDHTGRVFLVGAKYNFGG
ncbi:MAG: TonB-dependent receptor [Ponticaulis sp.]|nr:TonB-dependent receptor [Ponticaulis sp.]